MRSVTVFLAAGTMGHLSPTCLLVLVCLLLPNCAAPTKDAFDQILDERDAKRKNALDAFSKKQVSRPVSPLHQKFARDFLNKSLKDPYSAQITFDFTAYDPVANVYSVCGEVNAKNAYGGYVGAKPFWVNISNITANNANASGDIGYFDELTYACGR